MLAHVDTSRTLMDRVETRVASVTCSAPRITSPASRDLESDGGVIEEIGDGAGESPAGLTSREALAACPRLGRPAARSAHSGSALTSSRSRSG